ncbi:MAG: nucleotidyltransferase family protein [Gemmatimonadetes bacterium]|nr:nucleotidyltransferase family protein [Gemmatimonadota bacterium]
MAAGRSDPGGLEVVDAMVLAAGLGKRLRPLTNDTPKALIEVDGVPILERIIRYLAAAGVDRIIVNAHHHADQMERFVADRKDRDIEILLSTEPEQPLGTGGGLLHAAPLFRRDEPFVLYNGDIITDLDLEAMSRAHRTDDRLATLAVNHRETSRCLLFDDEGLYGWANLSTGESETSRPVRGEKCRIPFAGVHVLSPRIFDLISERGAFSIIPLYLRLARAGYRILPYDVSPALWLEIGNPERLETARRVVSTLRGRSGLSP